MLTFFSLLCSQFFERVNHNTLDHILEDNREHEEIKHVVCSLPHVPSFVCVHEDLSIT